MSQISMGNWQLVSVQDPCKVSVQDTGANVRTVIVSAPGPQGPSGTGGGSGGGGATSLSQLTDVQVSNPGAGDILSYDASTSKWTSAPRSQVTDGGHF